MRGKLIVGLVVILCALQVGLLPTAGQARQVYRFAYVEVSAGIVSLFSIDPHNPADAIPLYQIKMPPGYSFQEAQVSPVGRHLMIVYHRESGETAVYILDLGGEKYTLLFESFVPLMEFRWSPDANYLTFRQQGGSHTRYRAIPGWHAVDALPQPLPNLFDAHFAPDSVRLAGVMSRPAEKGIEYSVAVFDNHSGQIVNSPPVVSFSPFQTDPICALTWSPDGTWIAFNAPCDDSQPTELYLMDTHYGNLNRLSQNRADLSVVTDPLRFVTRQALGWENPSRLLVGQWLSAEPRPAPNPLPALVIHRTHAYDLTLNRIDPLPLSDHIALEWSKQPSGDLIAYRLRETTPEGSPLGEAVVLSRWSQMGVDEVGRFPAGCDWLQWSPDGQWLAYRELSQYCWEQPFLTLINAQTLEAVQHQVGVIDMKTVFWVGWLRVQ